MPVRPALAPFLAAAGAGALLAGLATLQPPLHRLTHEFTQLFTAFAALGLAGWLRHQGPRARLEAGLWAALGLGAGAWGLRLVTDGLVEDCATTAGSTFFWLTWVPAALLAACVGTAAGQRSWSLGRAALVVLGVGLGCLAHDLVQGLRGLRVVDPFLGVAGLIDQRAGLDTDAVAVLQRGWLVAVAGVLWAAHRGLPQARTLGGVLGAATLLLGSHLGLGWGTAALDAELDTTLTTPHAVVQFDSRGQAAAYAPHIAREVEWQLQVLAAHWPLPDTPIRVRLHEDDDQVGRLTGFANPHAWPGGMDLAWPDAFAGTLRHELVHVLQPAAFFQPLLLVDRALTEGVAEAYEDDLTELPAGHAMQAAAMRQGLLPPADTFLSLFGFSTLNEGAAYQASASFFGFLVHDRGWGPFAAYHRGHDLAGAYGADAGQLDADWRAFLAGVPTDRAAEIAARRVFDPRARPSYRSRSCPKLGERVPSARDRARVAWHAGEREAAAELYAGLAPESGVVLHAVRAVVGLVEAGRVDEARAVLEAVQGGSGGQPWAPDQADEIRGARVLVHLAAGQLDAAARVAATGHGDPAMDDLAGLLATPELAPAVAEMLTAPRGPTRAGLARALLPLAPDRADLRRLVLRHGFAWYRSDADELERPQLGEIDRGLALLARTPGGCDAVWRPVAAAGRRAAQLGALDTGARVGAALLSSCTDPRARHLGQRLEARVGWARMQDPRSP